MKNGFPERLLKLRKEKKLTQGELGQLVGLHYQHIGRYERGRVPPSLPALERLASVLGVSVEYLLGGTGEQVPEHPLQDLELLKQFQEAEQLPDEDKAVVKKLLDAFLTKKKLQSLLAS
jgi:transcriptional regulator with XRE-family HTH domain